MSILWDLTEVLLQGLKIDSNLYILILSMFYYEIFDKLCICRVLLDTRFHLVHELDLEIYTVYMFFSCNVRFLQVTLSW